MAFYSIFSFKSFPSTRARLHTQVHAWTPIRLHDKKAYPTKTEKRQCFFSDSNHMLFIRQIYGNDCFHFRSDITRTATIHQRDDVLTFLPFKIKTYKFLCSKTKTRREKKNDFLLYFSSVFCLHLCPTNTKS